MPSPAEDCFRTRALALPDHILVATDLTDTDYLVPHAVSQAKDCGARLTLVHAILPSDSRPVESSVLPDINDAKIDRDVRLILTGLKRQIEGHGLVCDVVYRHGFAGDVVREELERTGATRLVVRTHGRSKLGQIALGSVATALLTSARVPVFVVGPRAHVAGKQNTPRRILHPLSLAGDYIETVRLAFDLAQAYRAELILLRVFDPSTRENVDPERMFTWAQNALRALLPDTDDLMPPVLVKVAAGDLVKEILNAAAETEADWIVVGMDGALPLMHFRDSAAYRVVTAARCPVLALRHAPQSKKAVHEEADRFAGVIG